MTGLIAQCRERAAHHRNAARRAKHAIDRVAIGRLVVFVAILLAGAEAAHSQASRPWSLAGVALGAAVFIALVRYSAVLRAAERRASIFAHLNEQAEFRAERDWTRIVSRPWDHEGDPSGMLEDVGIFGTRSLVQLLPPLSPAHARVCLREWLVAGAAPDVLSERQDSARELGREWDFRDQLAMYAITASISPAQMGRLSRWVATSNPEAPWVAATSLLLPCVSVALMVGQALHGMTSPIWLISVGMTAGLSVHQRSRTKAILPPVADVATFAECYADVFTLISARPLAARRLAQLQGELASRGRRPAAEAFRRLVTIAHGVAARTSPMLHALLQAAFAYDCHLARAMDRWRTDFGSALEPWFLALGEIECLAAFGDLARTNPEWTFPDVRAGGELQVLAHTLGHALLPAGRRVANDVVIGPPGTVQLISGSNMSGKSTLLRAIGLNVVLARAGGPVCAESMRCPPLRLCTSIVIRDSLDDGLSYFAAELRRLKEIIAAADAAHDGDGDPVLYLIDEILRGTNSEERAVAARLIVDRLLNAGAIGVITTHDLRIFDAPPIAERMRHSHFRETFSGSGSEERMEFDYRLHAGPTTSRNALKLLALAGIRPVP